MSTELVAMRSMDGMPTTTTCTTGAASCINEKLPAEILLQIFRLSSRQPIIRRFRPSHSDYMAPIRMTHVCRAWRTLIHGSAQLWVDILDPAEKTAFTMDPRTFPIVLNAFEKSLPITPLSFSCDGAFLPVLSTLSPGHLSRISTMWLDCSDGPQSDIRPFLGLHIPQLERLTLWRSRSRSNRPLAISLESHTVQFPQLRYLRTNCMQLAHHWVTPGLRTLILGTRPREGERSLPDCCRFSTLTKLFQTLARCPDLEELEIDNCVPDPCDGPVANMIDLRVPPVRMHRLKVLHLGTWTAEVVGAVLEHMDLRDAAKITLRNHHHHVLADLLPRRNPVAFISQIRSVSLCIDDNHGSLDGQTEGTNPRVLSLQTDNVITDAVVDFYRLLFFFEGVIACLPSSNVARLDIVCHASHDRHSGRWQRLFEHFSRVTELRLDVWYLEAALSALSAANALVSLERLTIRTYARKESGEEIEAMISMLEERASRGMGLRSLSFTQQVDSDEVEAGVWWHTVADDEIARLKAVVHEVSVNTLIV